MFLDPPYNIDRCELYTHDGRGISTNVREYAIEHGDDPKMRIALCGYEDEHIMPDTWECVPWKANGGYAHTEQTLKNATLERIWFSPHCIKTELF
jgi:hypothetical protein